MSRIRLALIGAVSLALIMSVGSLVLKRHSTQKVVPIEESVTTSTTTPDEAPPVKKAYAAAPTSNEPERIEIPTIGVDSFVQRVGIDQLGQIAVPTNIYLTGWFIRSSLPGSRGLSIIDGHLDGVRSDGIFKHLAQVKPGDGIDITMGNSIIHHFTVMTVQMVPNAEAANLLFSQDPAVPSQLNLITCGGTFDTNSKEYDQRVIVTAKLN